MGKIGVGVGEDFPVDDGDGNTAAGAQGAAPGDDRAEFEAWKRARDDERRYREEKQRRHEEWHQRSRDFKDKLRAAAHESFGRDFRHDDSDWHDRHVHGFRAMRYWPVGLGIAVLAIGIPVLVIALFFSLISAAFKAPFVILALLAMAAFFVWHRAHHHSFGHYGRHDGRHGRYRYYDDSDIQTPPRPQQPPQPPAVAPIITPPPATGS